MNAHIEVNGQRMAAQPGKPLLSALRTAGISIPTLCSMDGLSPSGACRLCVVEVEGEKGLVPSCAYPIRDGLKVFTHSARALAARKTIVELLLADHPDDCLYCPRDGTCQLQQLARELGVNERRFRGQRSRRRLDVSSEAIVRDPAKCILCGRCVRTCEEVQTVGAIDFIGRGATAIVGTAFAQGLNVSSCVNCGQCVTACPTGALREQSHLDLVAAALADPSLTVVIQHAPAVSVTLAEEFGLEPGRDYAGAMTAALRRIGFSHVFDTSFAADLTIMEEASELVHRLTNGGVVPMMTSCSPGWIRFVETFYPQYIPNLSTCKSPQQMLGAIIKSFFATKSGVAPEHVFSVAAMPCTAKKYEAHRPEMSQGAVSDIDAVLTTRELARLIKRHGIDLAECAPEPGDTPFGERSSAGKIFGTSGGVMEAAVRTAHYLVTGEELADLELKELRGQRGVKKATVQLGSLPVSVAVVSGLANARQFLDSLAEAENSSHFIEVMTCPGGCINGGGQPHNASSDALRARMSVLYQIDGESALRRSHDNQAIKRLYQEYLGEPLSERSHRLLHTSYRSRSELVQ